MKAFKIIKNTLIKLNYFRYQYKVSIVFTKLILIIKENFFATDIFEK